MATVKTAISIDATLEKKVIKMAKKLNMSKSRIFAQAVEYFIERDENLELLQRINRAYRDEQDVEENKGSKTLYSRVIDKW